MSRPQKCHRTVCLYPVDESEPATHVVTGEEYCAACMKLINSRCLDLYPNGVIRPLPRNRRDPSVTPEQLGRDRVRTVFLKTTGTQIVSLAGALPVGGRKVIVQQTNFDGTKSPVGTLNPGEVPEDYSVTHDPKLDVHEVAIPPYPPPMAFGVRRVPRAVPLVEQRCGTCSYRWNGESEPCPRCGSTSRIATPQRVAEVQPMTMPRTDGVSQVPRAEAMGDPGTESHARTVEDLVRVLSKITASDLEKLDMVELWNLRRAISRVVRGE